MLNIEHAQENESLRERKKRQKLERITRAARSLFAKHGYEQTSTRQIAARAKVGVGTVFVYFPEKIDLLYGVFHEDIDRIQTEAFATVPAHAAFVDQMVHIFRPFYEHYAKHPRLARVYLKELLFLSGERRAAMSLFTAESLARIGELIDRARENGELDATVVGFPTAVHVFSLYYFSLVGWLGGGLASHEVALSHFRASLETLMQGIARKEEP